MAHVILVSTSAITLPALSLQAESLQLEYGVPIYFKMPILFL